MLQTRVLALIALIGLLLAACTPAPTATPTAVPTAMLVPTVSPTPTPASTATLTIPPTPTLGIGSTKTSADGAVMVYVPAGEFLMGSNDADNNAAYEEKPQHKVYLDAFWIDKFEVTNALYKKCVNAGKCSAPQAIRAYIQYPYYGNSQYDNYPVATDLWNQATVFCEWTKKQLPTEAQWEKAARGTDGRIYPWGNSF